MVKIDLGCGPNKREGFLGCDSIHFPGVDYVFDLGRERWPFDDSTVEEAHASHLIEHLTNYDGKYERVHFFNELYRVLIPGGKCTLIFPSWASNRYYGDPTHKEPFSEMGFVYLQKDWRLSNAPHSDAEVTGNRKLYKCDFDWSYGYNLHPEVAKRNQEYQMHAMTFFKEAAQDIIATVTAKK